METNKQIAKARAYVGAQTLAPLPYGKALDDNRVIFKGFLGQYDIVVRFCDGKLTGANVGHSVVNMGEFKKGKLSETMNCHRARL
jgi:hypothetical protein